MKISTVFLFFLWLAILYSCGQSMEGASEDPVETGSGASANEVQLSKQQFEMSGMELGQCSTMVFPVLIRTNGHIDVPPQSKAAVSVYYGGYVKGINLLPGQWVKQGQLLFQLENPDFVQMQQDYAETSAQLIYLRSDFERQEVLAQENIASRKNALKAESDYRVHQARMEGLKKKLQLLGFDLEKISNNEFSASVKIAAPISGFVTNVHTSSGSFLNASDVALEITNTDHLHLELDIFEKDINQLRKGQNIRFRVPGEKSKVFDAEVYLIGNTVVGESRVIRVHGHLENEREVKGLLPGMFVEAEIEVEAEMVKALPEPAVVAVEDKSYVLILKETTSGGYSFERQLVETGRRADGMIEILKALPEGAVVLTNGAFNLIGEE